MKCYLHRDNDAIALCKTCAKGVCAACAVDVSPGVVCSEECKRSAVETSEMIRASVAARKLNTRGGGSFVQPAFLAVLGIVFMAAPLIANRPANRFSLVAGGIMLCFGVILGLYQVVWHRNARRND